MKSISIIIPTFNGLELLRRYLRSVVEAVDHWSKGKEGGLAEIIVVDDGSADNSGGFIKENFPRIKVVILESQRGFARACNYGAKCSRGQVLIFLNNDVWVEREFIQPLLDGFEKGAVFAIGAKSITPKGWLYNESVSQAYFDKGVFTLVHPRRDRKNDYRDRPRPILYSCGAALACDRDKFFKLNGFDEIYAPFFWEDVDLCYRGWKRGWPVLYEPRSVVHHEHRQTISQVVSNDYAERIFVRNSYIFTWKNITSPRFFYRHLLYLFYWIVIAFMKRGGRDLAAFMGALKKLPEILNKRKIQKKEDIRSDEDILKETWLK